MEILWKCHVCIPLTKAVQYEIFILPKEHDNQISHRHEQPYPHVLIICALVCAGIVWGCSDTAVDIPASETKTLFSKKGNPDALMDDPNEGWDPEDHGWTEALAQEFFASEELARYDSLRKDVIDRIDDALDRGVEAEELADAFKDLLNGTNNADSTAGEYLFQSEEAADEYELELEFARSAIIAAFPLVINDDPDDFGDPNFDDSFNASNPGTCEITDETIDDFFANFEAIYEYENGLEGLEQDEGCQSWRDILKLSICYSVVAAVVSGTGGVAAVAAAAFMLTTCQCRHCPYSWLC